MPVDRLVTFDLLLPVPLIVLSRFIPPLVVLVDVEVVGSDSERGVASTVDRPEEGGVKEDELGDVLCPPVTAAAAALRALSCCDCIRRAICKAFEEADDREELVEGRRLE